MMDFCCNVGTPVQLLDTQHICCNVGTLVQLLDTQHICCNVGTPVQLLDTPHICCNVGTPVQLLDTQHIIGQLTFIIFLYRLHLNMTTFVSFLPILYDTRHDSSVATVTRLLAARLTNCNCFQTERKTFRHVRNFRRDSGNHLAPSSVDKDSFHLHWRGWAVSLITHLYQVSRLRMTGVIPSPPHA
jgi:hypothetical protein